MKTFFLISLSILTVAMTVSVFGQYNTHGMIGGLGFGGTLGITQTSSQPRLMVRGYLRQHVVDHLQGELSAGIGTIGGTDYNTRIIPFDVKAVYSPFMLETWNPFLYGGYGILHYKVEDKPAGWYHGAVLEHWAGYIPVGIGAQFRIDDQKALEISGGYNQTVTDDIDAKRGSKRDAFWTAFLGFSSTSESPNADADNDGLTNSVEKQLGTNPKISDTDGDGLSDGDEVNMYKTDPLKTDSDGDGISDSDEIRLYKTDPNKTDSDGDGLSDGDEILKYHTEPLRADTDGDGLSDGDEVLKDHTDPLKGDTDGGTVIDGAEVTRGTNPLDPSDDVPKKEEPKEEVKPVEVPMDISKVEKGQSISLEGIFFETGSAKISPSSEETLATVVKTLTDNPEVQIEIQGHTDSKGKEVTNAKLSKRRAEAVKVYLVNNGIGAERMTTKGYGSTKPIASNDTPEGREKNRRIEFMRIK